MAHMVETMAYAGELPWHGLGVKVIDDLTPEQMMQKAGVDWSVEKQDLVTKMGSSVKNKQALVRSSDGEVLDIVGKGWNPCLLYTSPSPRDMRRSRMPSSA